MRCLAEAHLKNSPPALSIRARGARGKPALCFGRAKNAPFNLGFRNLRVYLP